MKRIWSIGFGLERTGLLALRFPVLFSAIVLALCVAAAVQIPKVRFNGDVADILPEDSEAYRNYFASKERFRDFSRDVTVIVRSDRLMTAAGLEELRFLQLELAVTEGVAGVTSMFSLPLPDPVTGALGQFFPAELTDDAEAKRLVAELVERWPQARSLVAPERNLAVLLVTLEAIPIDGGFETWPNFVKLRQAASETAPEDFSLLYAGLTPIGGTIISALVSDQVKLSVIGLALGTLIAFAIYRSVLAAILCSVPPALTVLWSLGMIGFLEVRINYLTTVLPTLALIVAFADGIVLYYRWQASNAAKFEPASNLAEALSSVGPASSLTSITTVLAFSSFLFASGEALHVFALLGMACITLAFLAVIAGMPLTCHWAMKLGLVTPRGVRRPAFGGIGAWFGVLVGRRPAAFAIAAVGVIACLGYVHTEVRPEYRITDYLPADSDARLAEDLSNDVIGGRSLLMISVPKAEDAPVLSDGNLARLREVETAIRQRFEPGRIISPARLADGVDNPAALERLAGEIENSAGPTRSSFVSSQGDFMLVTVRVPSDQPIAETLDQLNDLRGDLAQLTYGREIVVAGFDVLMAEEFTRLIDQLRTSLLIAILLGVAIVGIATASPMLALVALTPNLLPILMIEFALYLRGGSVNLSEVIALTVAFGIAIDNAVHILNYWRMARERGADPGDAIIEAVTEVGPALAASTVIICVSSLVTQASALPMIPVLGFLIIATLILALISNLAILPANILALKGLLTLGAGEKAPLNGEAEQ